MKHFTVEGQWWLPDSPDRRVPGTLTFNDDGLELVLYDTLRRFEISATQVVKVGPPQWEVDPVVHGRTRDRRDFTLFEVGGLNMKGPFHDVQEAYRPKMALEGCYTHSDSFAEVWCQFDYLDAWANPPPVSVEGDDRDTTQVRLRPVDLARTEIGDASLRLVSGVEGSAGGERIDLTRWTSFAVTSPDPQPARILTDKYVRALQDLLMVCLGRPVRLTSLNLLPIDRQDPREGPAATYFDAVQPPETRTPAATEIESYGAPTILSLRSSPVAPDVLLTRWFPLWQTRREVLSLLLAPLYAPFMFSEHGFSSTFQSAEALHDLVLPTRDVDRADHRKRVDAVVQALEAANLDPAVVEWASNVLRSRNDKPLGRKIEDLVKSTGIVGEAVLTADAAFGSTAAAARTGVSHGGAGKSLDGVARYWYGQLLRWVVRARLLADLLEDPEEAQRRVLGRTPFRHALDQVSGNSDDASI